MLFKPRKLTFVFDGGAGSSSKGLRAAHIWKHHRESHTTFAVHNYMENAAHTVVLENGDEHVLQCLNSIVPLGKDAYQKTYISPGAAFAVQTIRREIEKYDLSPANLGIHPQALIIQDIDVGYERGTVDFEGNPKATQGSSNLNIGSTLHGCGAAVARRVLRRPEVVLAKDVDYLRPFLCNTAQEIADRLDSGQSGLQEIPQGYQLSLMSDFFPKTTSRNVSVAHALSDSLLPPSFAGPVVANFRTFPIRVNSNKYLQRSTGKICTMAEFGELPKEDQLIIYGDSGGCYPDQEELTWAGIRDYAGFTRDITEYTSLTKLPRRVYSFSRQNLLEALRFNNTGHEMFISVNFLNYVDAAVEGARDTGAVLTPKVKAWLKDNVFNQEHQDVWNRQGIKVSGMFLGTWKGIDDSVSLLED